MVGRFILALEASLIWCINGHRKARSPLVSHQIISPSTFEWFFTCFRGSGDSPQDRKEHYVREKKFWIYVFVGIGMINKISPPIIFHTNLLLDSWSPSVNPTHLFPRVYYVGFSFSSFIIVEHRISRSMLECYVGEFTEKFGLHALETLRGHGKREREAVHSSVTMETLDSELIGIEKCKRIIFWKNLLYPFHPSWTRCSVLNFTVCSAACWRECQEILSSWSRYLAYSQWRVV